MAKRVKKISFKQDGEEGEYYSLANTGEVLQRARSTLMRLLPSWEKVTGYKPIKDHGGRWLIPVESVQMLVSDPSLYLKLAGRATKWEDEQRDTAYTIKKLKDILKAHVPKSKLRRLAAQNPDLLGDL